MGGSIYSSLCFFVFEFSVLSSMVTCYREKRVLSGYDAIYKFWGWGVGIVNGGGYESEYLSYPEVSMIPPPSTAHLR